MQENAICIGNYKVIRHLNDGAFGSVFLVRLQHSSPRLPCLAMKVLNSERQQSIYERTRFMREVRFLGELNHRLIPHLYENGIAEDGTLFMVLEYAPHGSLRSLIQRYANGLMPFSQALTILKGVADILIYVHEQGILHLDIKPENILFNKNWEPMLVDFGIALTQEAIALRRSAARIGTSAYMAPERYLGYASRRTDQYSLAVLAFELFSGQLPFEASTRAALRHMQQNAQPMPPSYYNPTLPSYIDDTILKALEKLRRHRFDDVHSFVDALHGSYSIPTSPPSVRAAVPVSQNHHTLILPPESIHLT